MKWIKCSDKLPDDNQKVIIFNKGTQYIARYIKVFNRFFGELDWSPDIIDPDWKRHIFPLTHWMPLPEPPK